MKKLLKKLEDIMVAITFAEAGEYDEACKLSGSTSSHMETQPLEGFKETALENAGNK